MAVNIEQTDIDVEDWIDGVSYTQARVTIHRNPALYAQYEPLLAKIEAAEAEVAEYTQERDDDGDDEALGDAAGAAGEQSLGDPGAKAARDRLDALHSEAEALVKRYEDDVEVWHLRALDRDEIAEVLERHPRPVQPKRPTEKAAAKTKDAYRQRIIDWTKEASAAQHEANLDMLALAVMHVEVKGVEKPAPSLEGIRRVAKRPHGSRHIDELMSALNSITSQEVEISAPHRAGA